MVVTLLNTRLTWMTPPYLGIRMYGATDGPASAAGSGPAGCHAPWFQVPGAAGHDEMPPSGGPPAGPSTGLPEGNVAVMPAAAAATTAVIATATAALRITRRRARLRRTRTSGTGRSTSGRTQADSCSCSSVSSSMGHRLVRIGIRIRIRIGIGIGIRELALQPAPGGRHPVPDRARGDPAVAGDVIHGEI